MKRILSLVLACFALSSVAAAQQGVVDKPATPPPSNVSSADSPGDEPPTKAEVEQYFLAMHSRETMRATMDKMQVAMRSSLQEMFKNDKEPPSPEFEDRVSKVMAESFQSFPIEDMLTAMEPVIQKNYTRRELKAIVAFYSSPEGESMQKKQPEVLAETMQAIMPLLTKMQTDAVTRAKAEIEKMREEHQDTPKKS